MAGGKAKKKKKAARPSSAGAAGRPAAKPGGTWGRPASAGSRAKAPVASLPKQARDVLQRLTPERLSRLTRAQLNTVIVHLLGLAVQHRREREKRSEEAIKKMLDRQREEKQRAKKEVQRQALKDIDFIATLSPAKAQDLAVTELVVEQGMTNDEAVAKIQARFRGMKARRRVVEKRLDDEKKRGFHDFCAQISRTTVGPEPGEGPGQVGKAVVMDDVPATFADIPSPAASPVRRRRPGNGSQLRARPGSASLGTGRARVEAEPRAAGPGGEEEEEGPGEGGGAAGADG